MTETFSASEIVQAVKIKLTETRNEFDTRLIAMFADEQRALRAMVHELMLEVRERLLTLKDGQDGRDGQDGEPGPEGPAGQDGRDGADGAPGANGRDGIDGKDGVTPELDLAPLTLAMMDKLREDRLDLDEKLFAARQRFDRLAIEFEERIATLKDGEQGPAGEPGPQGEPGRDGDNGKDGITGEARGKYDPDENYGKFDRVSFNGSEWIAKMDDPGQLPGDGWMLGATGKKGRPGDSIEGARIDGYALVLEMTTVKGPRTLRIDLRPLFERYHDEAGQ